MPQASARGIVENSPREHVNFVWSVQILVVLLTCNSFQMFQTCPWVRIPELPAWPFCQLGNESRSIPGITGFLRGAAISMHALPSPISFRS
jgi:hypothetical protein